MATSRKRTTFKSTDAVHISAPDTLIDPLTAARYVKSTTGKGYFRQLLEIAKLRFGGRKFGASEYYRFGLHNPSLSTKDRNAFVGNFIRDALNGALCSNSANQNALMHDKFRFSTLLNRNGIPTTETQAYFCRDRDISALVNLHSAAEIVDFVVKKAKFPLFGKPNARAFGIGTLSITQLSPDRHDVTLGNGQIVKLQHLAEDIEVNFQKGYAFQEHLQQHPTAVQACGTAIGTLRIATILLKRGPALLYAHQRIPGANAMSDSAHTKMRENAEIDVTTGKVVQHYFGDRTFGHAVPLARVSQKPYVGTQMPFWPEIVKLLTRGHALFPNNGCIGWDVALTVAGPVIVEAQGNPFHMHWQLAAGRGLLNSEFSRMFLEALDIIGYCEPGLLFDKLQAQASGA